MVPCLSHQLGFLEPPGLSQCLGTWVSFSPQSPPFPAPSSLSSTLPVGVLPWCPRKGAILYKPVWSQSTCQDRTWESWHTSRGDDFVPEVSFSRVQELTSREANISLTAGQGAALDSHSYWRFWGLQVKPTRHSHCAEGKQSLHRDSRSF